MRTAVIGNENCILGFALVGVEGHIARDVAGLEAALSTCLADRKIGLLLVSSDVADLARARIDKLKVESLSPLVVEVPGQEAGSGYPSLKDLVQRAVGISLGGG